ncbi:hypothetical protein K376_02432 [Streptomyces sp. PsTaAH-130]|nr:hypothetical protein K376_02432 [Streptomyces sp. PsTaAH-130]
MGGAASFVYSVLRVGSVPGTRRDPVREESDPDE